MTSLAFSAKQVGLEFQTNLIATGSFVTANLFDRILQNQVTSKKFGLGSLKKAISEYQAAYRGKHGKTMAILDKYGQYDSDSERFSRSEYDATTQTKWFNSRWLFFFNTLPSKYFKSIVFLAQMIEDGNYDAHSYDEKTFVLSYDYKKDGRFFKKDGTFKSLEHQKLYEAVQRDMAGEYDGLDKEGNITKAYTQNELNTIKEDIIRYYGGMDKDARTQIQSEAFGRLFMKFKSWMIPKFQSYYTERHISDVKGYYRKIYDDSHEGGFYYTWEGDIMEGIFQTFYTLYQGAIIGEIKTTLHNLTPSQRRNISMLLGDLTWIGILFLLKAAIFRDDEEPNTVEWFKTPMGKLYFYLFENALGDLIVFRSLETFITDTPFYGLSSIMNVIKNLFRAGEYAVNGEITDSMKQFIASFGAGRSVVGYF
jgi:hypothetical protein